MRDHKMAVFLYVKFKCTDNNIIINNSIYTKMIDKNF